MTYNRVEEGGAFVSGNENHIYIAIDLKSFYASVECRERDLDPLTTNLVVADAERTEKTICLAVSPSLKVYGIPGRARLFEVVQRVKEVNQERSQKLPKRMFEGSSCFSDELKEHPELSVTYVTAKPRMALYMKYSTQIYDIYLRYIAPEDMHVYSIDEVFMDVTHYLNTYHMTAKELASKMILDVMQETSITATAGIGTNLYLCKVAMDIVAKHVAPDANGVRIAELDEVTYRKLLWSHRPLTDFWRVGRGYARKLAEKEEIDIRLYYIIYTAIEEIKSAMEGMLSPEFKEEITSTVEVLETFKITKVGTIAGCIVRDGKITRSSKVRVIRDGIVIFTGELGSLKRFKDDVKEVSKGFECGLNINNYNDIQTGDFIESFEEVAVKKTL